MLTIYLAALGFGATLLIATLVFGDGQGEATVGHDLGAGHVDGHGDAFGWLPVTSLRFWVFLLAFGGLTGTVLTYATSASPAMVAAAASAVGWVSGVGMVAAMRGLQRGAGSELRLAELGGETAEVVVAVGGGQVGKVRVTAKGRVFDLLAETDDAERFAIGAKVMIVGEGEDGRVAVARSATT